MARPRRVSSNLGGDPRGDTGAPAMSTLPVKDRSAPGAVEKSLKPRSKRRRVLRAFRRWKSYSVRHTWLNPLIIILFFVSFYAVSPTPSNAVHSALFLSYPLGSAQPGGPVMYGKGKRDITFVAFYTVVFSFTREFLMQRVIRPVAVKLGIRGRAKQSRFMEQAYTAMYFVVFGPFGLYVMSRGSLWYFDTTAMFEGFPHRQHDAFFKAYYLLQAGYWTQQAIVLVLLLEKPRKDFKELVLHHIVTLALIGLSYRFHFAYMGIAVYITHDISDFFLATSKILNYVDSVFVGPYFVFFVAVWIYLRHYLNLCILWAVCTKFSTVGPFELNWETQQYKCWISQYITFALLACLQAVNVYWLFLILRIAKNYVFADTLGDERSDNEETGVSDSEEPVSKDKAARRSAEKQTKAQSDSPLLLVNGDPIDQANGRAKPLTNGEGIEKEKSPRKRRG